jgi:hypothetical protein
MGLSACLCPAMCVVPVEVTLTILLEGFAGIAPLAGRSRCPVAQIWKAWQGTLVLLGKCNFLEVETRRGT